MKLRNAKGIHQRCDQIYCCRHDKSFVPTLLARRGLLERVAHANLGDVPRKTVRGDGLRAPHVPACGGVGGGIDRTQGAEDIIFSRQWRKVGDFQRTNVWDSLLPLFRQAMCNLQLWCRKSGREFEIRHLRTVRGRQGTHRKVRFGSNLY